MDDDIPTLIDRIHIHCRRRKSDGQNLLFVDEIQNSPDAIRLLRYFKKEVPWLYVIASDSSLETLIDKHVSFPVGRVEYMALRPCSFVEFLNRDDQKQETTEPHEPTKHVENTTKGLKVTFGDGTVIWHRAAIDTFIETLKKIGLEHIPQIGITHSGYKLVGKEKRNTAPGRIWQHECEGWYIYSNISNSGKARDLKLISDTLGLNLKIEEGKPQ